jgi:hypothetical protein
VLVLQDSLFLDLAAKLKVAVRDLTISLQQEGVADLDIMTTTQQMAAVVAVVAGIPVEVEVELVVEVGI